MEKELELPWSGVAWLDGVLFAPVNGGGVWGALRDARGRLRGLRGEGVPRVVFVQAVDGDARAVTLLDPSAAALMVGYRLEG